MPTTDERLASLEARVDTMDDLRTVITDMRSEMQREFAAARADMQREFAAVRAEMREEFAIVRTDMREMRADMTRQFADVNGRFEVLNQKVGRDFRWIVGILMTVMTAVMGVLFTAVLRQL